MSKSRSELDNMLDELERDLAMLIMDHVDHADVWAAFAGQAETIEASASADDIEHVKARTNDILRSQGIVEGGGEAERPA
jgi:hypothetical protein